MHIEIVTTKKKLTKSVIDQMYQAPIKAMECGEVLGYMLRASRYCYKVILIEYSGDYYIMPADYCKDDGRIYRKGGNFKKFHTQEDADKWWDTYMEVVRKATTHIYF